MVVGIFAQINSVKSRNTFNKLYYDFHLLFSKTFRTLKSTIQSMDSHGEVNSFGQYLFQRNCLPITLSGQKRMTSVFSDGVSTVVRVFMFKQLCPTSMSAK